MTESGLYLRYKINPSLEIRCPIPRPWNKGSNKTGHLTINKLWFQARSIIA